MSTKFRFWLPASPPTKGSSFPSGFASSSVNGFDPEPLIDVDPISREEFTQTALETGYGSQTAWPITFWLDPTEQETLGLFLSQRAQSVASMLDFSGGRILPRPFSKCLETSEWSALSYMVGQVGATLAVRRWLGPHRTPIEVLHKSVFSNAALVKATVHAMPKNASAKMVPDLLVRDHKSDWHLVEAKGGKANYRSRAVAKGLQQVDAHDTIRTAGGTAIPLSRVCCFTHLERPTKQPKPLRFDVVDPEGPKDTSELILYDGLATAMSRMIVDSMLRALPALAPDRRSAAPVVNATWRETGHPQVVVAVPGANESSTELAFLVALMLSARHRLSSPRARRNREVSSIASEIVQDALKAVPTHGEQSKASYMQNCQARIELCLKQMAEPNYSIQTVWNALEQQLDLPQVVANDTVSRSLNMSEAFARPGAVKGRTQAAYVTVPRLRPPSSS